MIAKNKRRENERGPIEKMQKKKGKKRLAQKIAKS